MWERMVVMIEWEVDYCLNGGIGCIVVKMNFLVDIQIICVFYVVFQVGVQIDLIVWGICCF